MSEASGEQSGSGSSLYREDTPEVASIRVRTETELHLAWEFKVGVGVRGETSERIIRVRLSYADYEFWSHGASSPARVTGALMDILAGIRSPLLQRGAFDAARARHEHPDIDERLSEVI